MNLDSVAAVLRDRQGVQGIDLGVLLGRRFYGAILKPWLLLVVPLTVVLQVVGFAVTGSIWWALLFGWWLKPLFDRIPLYVLSRGFFGAVPGTMETVKAVGRQMTTRAALWDLTVGRFSTLRVLTIPIRVLEGSRGGVTRQRLKVLFDGSTQGAVTGWLFFLLFVKGLFYLGLVILLMMVLPEELVGDVYYFVSDELFYGQTWPLMWAVVGSTALVSALVEPFHMAGGFGMYIQRRIVREGWDLELKFKKLSGRLAAGLDGAAMWVGVVLSVVVLGMVGAPEAAAEGEWSHDVEVEQELVGSEPPALDRSRIPVDPEVTMAEVLAEPPLVREETTEKVWRRRIVEDPEHWEPGAHWALIGQILAEMARVVLWIFVAALVLFGLWKAASYLGRGGGAGEGKAERSRWEEELLAESDGEGLPDDVAAAARQLFAAGEARRALAILLLKSLLEYEERRRFEFPVGWTTARCARKVAHLGRDGALVAEVARAFDRLAWAGEEVSDEEFRGLMEQWESVFGDRGRP